ncbi:TonB-dependent receptor domain-containing protein [Variovorax ginsengisoli]|uniref:Vitamin B12 transporter n=1 Tax=Variovorax ginsengisoli TaxID=363844 RepID=A0ABT9SDV9_9BURK|nr:TonB-dependent receptor [Variovorax ginsengisoli]MDP9902534.1 vitamin B12 transporter [Variovorax ginsengisoli]
MNDLSVSAGADLPAGVRLAARPFAFPWALAAALAATQAVAQPATVASLGETVVTATRVAQPVSEVLSDVSIVDRETIERSGATGVADVLARLPGVEIARNGGVGNTSSVFIRGAESRFTAVYIDGVRVDSQSTGGASWETIPLSQIDRIEVLRGPAAAVYGSDAIGGVIQFFTKRGEGPARPSVGLGIGSNGLRHAEAGVSGAAGVDGAFDYSLAVAHTESKGFNVRPDSSYNPDRDGYRSTSAHVRLGLQINPRQRIEATVLANDLNSGYDDFGYSAAAPVDDRNKYSLRTAGLTWSSQWTDVWRTRVSVTESRSNYETEPDFYRTETTLRGYLLQNEFRFGAHLVTASLERREDALNNPGTDFTPTLARDRSQDGVALGYSFVKGPHSVQLHARHDDDSEFGGKNTGSAGYGFAFTPQWRATVSAGTAFRAPTLYQRFSEYGVASLQPEQSRNVELGLKYSEGATSAGVTVYRNRLSNLIDFDGGSTACGSGFGCYANTARAQYEGLTFTAAHRIGAVSLRASADFQDPRDLDTDKQLARRARRHGVLGADWRVAGWTLGAELQASSRRYDDAANTRVLGGYTLLNLVASTPLTRDLSLIARLDNAGDKNYMLARGYATAGRSAYLGLKWMPQ